MKSKKRRPAPKQLRAVQASRHWRVSHYHHTGHVLPHASTSYPVLAMILLCTGVFLAGWTHFATADPPTGQGSYAVHTSVPGPPPPNPAVISSPKPGTHTSISPITVTGSCDAGNYVELFRNGFASGTAICDASGHYQIAIDLFNGLNQLVARVHNFANVAGPDSGKVNVYYAKPGARLVGATITSSAGASGSSAYGGLSTTDVVQPLVLQTDYQLQGFYTGQTASWDIGVGGGLAPYAINVDWGDHSYNLYSRAHDGPLKLQHTYHKKGGYKGSYMINIATSDSAGSTTSLQLLAIVNDPPHNTAAGVTAVSGGQSGASPTGIVQAIANMNNGDLGHLVKYAWPTYGVTTLMLASFWLGEVRQLHRLRPHLRKPRHA